MAYTDTDLELTTEDFERACECFRSYKPNAKPLFEESGVEYHGGLRCVVLADANGWFAAIAFDNDETFPFTFEDLLGDPGFVEGLNEAYGKWVRVKTKSPMP